jgi:hypothetical protein
MFKKSENRKDANRSYLALGDSMSIDYYTGITGGGAVSQFYKSLGPGWKLIDKTCDGCLIEEVPVQYEGHLITLTIAGNNAVSLLWEPRKDTIESIISNHYTLLNRIRSRNPDSCIIVGNIYYPDMPLTHEQENILDSLNSGIAENVAKVRGRLADIYQAFRGHEKEFLCMAIEPTFKGAKAICRLFKEQYDII